MQLITCSAVTAFVLHVLILMEIRVPYSDISYFTGNEHYNCPKFVLAEVNVEQYCATRLTARCSCTAFLTEMLPQHAGSHRPQQKP